MTGGYCCLLFLLFCPKRRIMEYGRGDAGDVDKDDDDDVLVWRRHWR